MLWQEDDLNWAIQLLHGYFDPAMCSTKGLNAERAIDLPTWRMQPKEPPYPPPVKPIPAWRNRTDVTSGVPRAFHGPPPPVPIFPPPPPPMPNVAWVPEAMPRSPYALTPEELASLAAGVLPMAKPSASAKVQAVSWRTPSSTFYIKTFRLCCPIVYNKMLFICFKSSGFLDFSKPHPGSNDFFRSTLEASCSKGKGCQVWAKGFLAFVFLWKYVQYISGSNIQNLKYKFFFHLIIYRILKAYLQNQGGQSEGSTQGALWGSHPSVQKTKEDEEGKRSEEGWTLFDFFGQKLNSCLTIYYIVQYFGEIFENSWPHRQRKILHSLHSLHSLQGPYWLFWIKVQTQWNRRSRRSLLLGVIFGCCM